MNNTFIFTDHQALQMSSASGRNTGGECAYFTHSQSYALI